MPEAYAVSYANRLADKRGFGLNIAGNNIGFIAQSKSQAGFSYSLVNKGDHGLSIGTIVGLSLFNINEGMILKASMIQ
ncbi:MAG: hypothetical protein ACJAXX_001379 [Roseivirga sp.]